MERQAESYFFELLAAEQVSNPDLTTVLKVFLTVDKDSWTSDNTITLDSTVTLLYRSESESPLMLDQVLEQVIQKYSIPSDLRFGGAPVVNLVFEGLKDDSKIVYVEDNEGLKKSGQAKGLIVAVSFLSVVLILVSSVLLYITGGWDAIHRCLTNFLFEEVEDGPIYLSRSKSTLGQSSDENEANGKSKTFGAESEEDVFDNLEDASLEDSAMTGPHLTPKGNLGAMPVTQGLGIKTPDASEGYGGVETPDESAITDMTDKPMGIASMRKMDRSSTPGGLSQFIMKRLNSSNKGSRIAV
jgi:hypothetical protein